MTDSAGVPWAGRRFEPNPSTEDDGRADPGLAEALRRFRRGEATQADVVDALRTARVLVPLVAREGEQGSSARGASPPSPPRLRADRSQELSLVEVETPDGRRALPAFSSTEAMRAWNPEARPIPVDARRVALAAVAEGTDIVVLDPGSDGGFALRGPAIRALATEAAWRHPADDPAVQTALARSLDHDPDVLAARALVGDPTARLDGPELVVAVVLRDGLDADARRVALGRVTVAWAEDPVLREAVDSMAVSAVSG